MIVRFLDLERSLTKKGRIQEWKKNRVKGLKKWDMAVNLVEEY